MVDVRDGAMTRQGAAEDPWRDEGRCATGRIRTRRRTGRSSRNRCGRTWQVHQGKELSYTNLLDLDAAVRIALEFTEPAGVVIKHTNPCGVATGVVSGRRLRSRARGRSAVSVRRHRRHQPCRSTRKRRQRSTSTFIEAVIAPAVADDAREILAKKANMRVVTADFTALAEPMPFGDFEGRSFLGGMLHQQRDRVDEARDPWPRRRVSPKVVTSVRRPGRSGRRCASRGASARTSSRTRSSSRPPIARSPSAPGR